MGFVKRNRASREISPEYTRRNRGAQKSVRQNRKIWSNLSEVEKKERAGELRRLREK